MLINKEWFIAFYIYIYKFIYLGNKIEKVYKAYDNETIGIKTYLISIILLCMLNNINSC